MAAIGRSPGEEGYHLTDDLTDKAIEFIRDADPGPAEGYGHRPR